MESENRKQKIVNDFQRISNAAGLESTFILYVRVFGMLNGILITYLASSTDATCNVYLALSRFTLSHLQFSMKFILIEFEFLFCLKFANEKTQISNSFNSSENFPNVKHLRC